MRSAAQHQVLESALRFVEQLSEREHALVEELLEVRSRRDGLVRDLLAVGGADLRDDLVLATLRPALSLAAHDGVSGSCAVDAIS